MLTSALLLQKLSILWKITFMTLREKNYVLIINLGGMFEDSWKILVNFRMHVKFCLMSKLGLAKVTAFRKT